MCQSNGKLAIIRDATYLHGKQSNGMARTQFSADSIVVAEKKERPHSTAQHSDSTHVCNRWIEAIAKYMYEMHVDECRPVG